MTVGGGYHKVNVCRRSMVYYMGISLSDNNNDSVTDPYRTGKYILLFSLSCFQLFYMSFGTIYYSQNNVTLF